MSKERKSRETIKTRKRKRGRNVGYKERTGHGKRIEEKKDETRGEKK